MRAPVVLAFGGGTNSSAVIVGKHELGEPIDLILFADTGAERPETYRHVAEMSAWCVAHGYPAILTVQTQNRDGEYITLEEKCLSGKMLPSLAYGFKSCSDKHKRRPQDKFVNHWAPAMAAWARGQKVIKLIGYDADETRRAKIFDDEKYDYHYPLIQWDWGREECVEAIARAGISQPGKSSCFFCPSMTKPEIRLLQEQHPDLLQRALTVEANAELTSVKGLGRRFNWRQFVEDEKSCPAGESHIEIDCGCYDGGPA